MQAWVIGNWKQNPATISDVNTLLETLLAVTKNEGASNKAYCQLMVAPSCIHLAHVSARLQGTSILTAAQDISAHSDSSGAYTGDCSAQQVADAGATWTILGHSERRQYHQESHETLLNKLGNALKQDLGVVFCIGETQAQYDGKQTFNVLDDQLAVIKDLFIQRAEHASEHQSELTKVLAERLIIAYEPVWAIGTGKIPTVTEVEATHQHIKETVASFDRALPAITVLYGGSVNTDNADSFAASPMIDGALVGGASLKAESFIAIADAFSQAKTN
ncbi:triose-phosphate isomerase [Psychrobacter sp. P11G5]|uniref:triose-phosphate isomerase n=1 Tax=Psychrobacter sp. P11G5 TaxID=1699624 RepID=UPI0008299812|nr:triose-phosphate isomerase [Psychrobacter sp. P11G5]